MACERYARAMSRNNYAFASAFDSLVWSNGLKDAWVAKWVCRDVRTVKDWRSGARPCPKWAFDLVFFQVLDDTRPVRKRIAHHAWVDLRFLFGPQGEDGANDARLLDDQVELAEGSPLAGSSCELEHDCLASQAVGVAYG